MLITAPLSWFGCFLLFLLHRSGCRNEGFVCLVNWVDWTGLWCSCYKVSTWEMTAIRTLPSTLQINAVMHKADARPEMHECFKISFQKWKCINLGARIMHCSGGLNCHGNHFQMEIYLSDNFGDDHTYILLKMAHWNNKTVFFLSYIIKGLETSQMYYEGNMVLVAHVVLMFGWRCCGVVAYKNSLLASK